MTRESVAINIGGDGNDALIGSDSVVTVQWQRI
jgi:hypothetical protein